MQWTEFEESNLKEARFQLSNSLTFEPISSELKNQAAIELTWKQLPSPKFYEGAVLPDYLLQKPQLSVEEAELPEHTSENFQVVQSEAEPS